MLQDEFGEDDDRDQKSEYRDLSRVSLMLDLRAQIEEESRKVLSQGQSKKSRTSIEVVAIAYSSR